MCGGGGRSGLLASWENSRGKGGKGWKAREREEGGGVGWMRVLSHAFFPFLFSFVLFSGCATAKTEYLVVSLLVLPGFCTRTQREREREREREKERRNPSPSPFLPPQGKNRRWMRKENLCEKMKCVCVCVWVGMCMCMCMAQEVGERERDQQKEEVSVYVFVLLYLCVW